MANRRAVASGNWSNVATWDGGATLPQPGDVVRPGGFTVTIDQDVNVQEFRTDAGGGASAGGTFQITSLPGGAGRTVQANLLYVSTSSQLFDVTAAVTSGVLNLIGTIQGPSAGFVGLRMLGSGFTVNHTGNIDCAGNTSGTGIAVGLSGANITWVTTGNITNVGGGTASALNTGIRCTAANPNVTVIGNITSAATTAHSQSAGIELFSGVSGTPVVVVTGNLTCTVASFEGLIRWAAGSGSLTVNGNVSGAGVSVQAGAVTVAINGTATSPNASHAVTISSSSACTVTITGTVSGNVTTGYGLVVTTGAHVVTLSGAIAAGTGCPAVLSTSGLIRMRGPFTWATGNVAPFQCSRMVVYSGVRTEMTVKDDASFPATGGNRILSNTETNGFPAPEDVRAGVTYGEVGEITGTMLTEIEPAEFWQALIGDVDTPGTIGARLVAVATVDSVGAQIAAALGE